MSKRAGRVRLTIRSQNEAAMVADRISQGDPSSPAGSLRTCGTVGRKRRAGAWLTVAAAITLAGCPDGERLEGPEEAGVDGFASNAVVSASASPVAAASGVAAQTSVAYVWLPPDSVPDGEIASILNARTGLTVTTVMTDGGFDPVPIVALAGDRLEVEIQTSGGGGPISTSMVVPASRKPRVVRTRPLPRKRDIVLNARPIVVFSEPVTEGTVGGSVRLLRDGQPVNGRVALATDGLRAEFQPEQLLAPNTDYVLSVRTGVTDLAGDTLEAAVEVEFTTGTTTAVAIVATDPAALYTVANGELRTFQFDAILHDDDRVTGTWSVFNPSTGGRGAGPVTCLSIIDGAAAWVGAVFAESNRPEVVGVETGWIAVDNARFGEAVPDQLTFAIGLEQNGFGTTQDFCDNTPAGPTWDGLWFNDVEVGDIVVAGSAPPRGTASLRRQSLEATVGTINTLLVESFRVYVLDERGNTVSGVPIDWAVTAGGGSVTPARELTATDDGVGHATSTAMLTLGPDEGEHVVTATASTLPGAPQITFTATAVTVMVRIRDAEGFVPKVAQVAPGQSVGWLYESHAPDLHFLVFEDTPGQTIRLGPGMFHVRTFSGPPGAYRYRCTIHSADFDQGEVGVVLVQP